MDRKRVIELLNEAVADELAAVNQYMYFHFHLTDQGFGPLSTLFKMDAIEEMTHVEQLAERILFLKGDVEMAPSGPVEKLTDPEQMLVKARQLEEDATDKYNRFALECGANADATTKKLFEALVADEEKHMDLYDTQLDNIRRFGPNFLALQTMGGPPSGGPPAAG